MQPQPTGTALSEVLERIREHRRRERWIDIAALAGQMPGELAGQWLEVADSVAFALGVLRRTDEAASLLERAFAVEPAQRRASSLAYLYYDALLAARRPGRPDPEENGGPARAHERAVRSRDREKDRRAFTRWMQEALRLDPRSVKDLYRLGIYEAQIQSRRDRAALRAFERALAAYRELPPGVKAARKDLHKYFVRALYAAARSAYRLGMYVEAQRHAFACIREDRATDHVEPVHKLHLGGKVCAARGRLDDAERGFRLALDAKGPPERDFVFAALAEVTLRAGRIEDAAAWIEKHVPPHHRKAYVWRLLGDIRRQGGKAQAALDAYENALRKDRAGRHLTLVRMGDIHRAEGQLDRAERAYEKAAEFSRRRYLSEDRGAIAGLLAVAEARGDHARAEELRRALAELERGRFRRAAPAVEVAT